MQKNPTYSISLRTIAQIITAFNRNSNKQPSRFSRILSQSPEDEGNLTQFNNIPDDSTRLKNMHKAAVHLSSQPIFKYICYNCGHLITGNFGRVKVMAFDANSLGLTYPPALEIFDSIGELSYTNSKGIWIACNNYRKRPVDLYNACDPNTGKLYVPEALKDLVSPYERGQIALAGLISKIVKPRNDKFKIWEHIQGQIQTRDRLDYHYFGMYGFMVAKDDQPMGDDKGEETPTEVQLRIQRALFWLREHNPLYKSFMQIMIHCTVLILTKSFIYTKQLNFMLIKTQLWIRI